MVEKKLYFMGDPFVDWLRRKGLSETTIKNYIFYYIRIKDIPLSQDVVNKLIDIYPNNFNCNGFLNNYISFYGLWDIKLPKRTGRVPLKIPKWLSVDEVEILIKNSNQRRDSIMIELTFQGGLRVSELLGIKAYDFNWNGWLEDREANGELVVLGKNKRERVVYLNSYLMYEVYNYIKQNQHKIGKKDSIFRISERRWEKIIEELSRKYLNKRINPHVLRHSTATFLLKSGWNIVQVSEYLGHKDISTTQIYTHINKGELKERFNKVFNDI